MEDQFLLRAGAPGSRAGGLAWPGREPGGRPALQLRARCNSAASLAQYTPEMEAIPASVGTPSHHREWRDD